MLRPMKRSRFKDLEVACRSSDGISMRERSLKSIAPSCPIFRAHRRRAIADSSATACTVIVPAGGPERKPYFIPPQHVGASGGHAGSAVPVFPFARAISPALIEQLALISLRKFAV